MNVECGIKGEAQRRIAIFRIPHRDIPHSTFCIPN